MRAEEEDIDAVRADFGAADTEKKKSLCANIYAMVAEVKAMGEKVEGMEAKLEGMEAKMDAVRAYCIVLLFVVLLFVVKSFIVVYDFFKSSLQISNLRPASLLQIFGSSFTSSLQIF